MSTPSASLLIRPLPQYRHDAFERAIRQLGYSIRYAPHPAPGPDDILLIWNRYTRSEDAAGVYERRGAPVIVVENGYLDMRDTKKTFAMALNHHNGAGETPTPDGARAHKLAAELRPWRGWGEGPILLLPQRGIGERGVAMLTTWPEAVQRRIRQYERGERRFIQMRWHPAGLPLGVARVGAAVMSPSVPLEEDLAHCALAVTWGSGAALKALVAGVPTIFEFDKWIGRDGGSYGVETINDVRLGDREAMLERVAWAQWSVEEVETGEPIRRLVERHKEIRACQ